MLTSTAGTTLPPTTTTLTSSANPATEGQPVTFTANVAAPTGAGSLTGSVSFEEGSTALATGTLNASGQATFTTSTLALGSDTIGATYNGGPDFASSRADPHTQSVAPAVGGAAGGPDGPTIVSMLRYGYHMMPTTIVLTFDQALDAVTADDAKDYRIIGPTGRTIAITKAVYDAANLTVTLQPVHRISIHHPYKLIVDGTAPSGLTNTQGQLLDGANRGSPDSDYRAPLTWRNLVISPQVVRKYVPKKSTTAGVKSTLKAREINSTAALFMRSHGSRREPQVH